MNLVSSIANPTQHCESIVIQLLKILNIDVTRLTIQKDLLEHPDYPSLLSISDVLKNYGVDNIALRMERASFQQLDIPFIVHIRGKKIAHEFFGIVSSLDNNTITVYDSDSNKYEILTNEEFDKMYKGTVLAVEAGEHTGEKNYAKNRKQEKQKDIYNLVITFTIPALVIALLIANSIFQDFTGVIGPAFFTLFTLAGCVIGVLLLWHEVDEYNPTIRDICHAGKKVNCSAILNSTAAKVFGISWSILGSTYFIGMLLSLLTGGITNTYNLYLLSWINVIVLPYIIYSVSYQYFVAKQWCILCLAVQGILALQFATAFIGGFHSYEVITEVPYQPYFTIASCFGLAFVTLLLLIPTLEKAKESHTKTISLQRLKHNPQIFESLLAKQKQIEHSTEGLGIILGTPNAKYQLIKVCNPYCSPCARAHPIMEELLEKNNDLQIQIIFTVTEKENDYRAKPVNHLLAIASHGDEFLTKKALDDWYNAPVKDYSAFAAKHPLNGELEEQQGKIKQMSDWCAETKIKFTPTFFVNGNQLPEMYNVADLKYFLTV